MSDTPADGRGWGKGIRYLGDNGDEYSEALLIRRFIEQINDVQAANRRKAGTTGIQRAFHAKVHACMEGAEFRIADEIPADLRTELFQPGAVHEATVRLSSAAGTIRPDREPDLRGIALRIHSHGLTPQDLLLTNAAVSHVQDAEQFLKVALAGAASRTRFVALVRMCISLGPVETWRTLQTLLPQMRRPVSSLATETYWGRVPYAFGEVALRFRLRPQQTPSAPAGSGDHYLRSELVQRLRQEAVVFAFQVQRYRDEISTPIESARQGWDTPFETIATLVLPRLDLDDPVLREAENRLEGLEFNPWNTGDDITPIGSLNRARKLVYAASADLRAGRRSREYRSDLKELSLKLAEYLFRGLNLVVPWHRLPVCLGLANLALIRDRARRTNLYHNPGEPLRTEPFEELRSIDRQQRQFRSADGGGNDLLEPDMGRAGTRFGRNVPLAYCKPAYSLSDPDPRAISEVLMRRESFIAVRELNMLAAAWIQFQVHGWFNHPRLGVKQRKPGDILWEDPVGPTRLAPTPHDKGGIPGHPRAFINTESHWWDGSQLYGSSLERQLLVRGYRTEDEDTGEIRLERRGNGDIRLPAEVREDLDGVELTGFNDNWWAGLSLLHTLFASEHNAICTALRRSYPHWRGSRVFETARLINCALMAKIHTVEWSPGLLDHPTIRVAFDTYWWGLASQEVCSLFKLAATDEVARGLPGSALDHHGMPYEMSEEFVTVYRMHPLLPDEICFFSLGGDFEPMTRGLDDFAGANTRSLLDETGMASALYSFGRANPGALTLNNFPEALRNHTRIDGERLDLAAVDVLRDRERGVPRYNMFRRMLHLRPYRSFSDMTPDRDRARKLEEVYGDIEKVDALVGMLAEVPPQGFGFSETAFRIFIVMASRRLQSDRFFTTDYRPEVYTDLGLRWVEDNDMKTVLLRHYPQLAPALEGVANAFAPWNPVH